LSLSRRGAGPKVVLLHGPLVNPVSPYALEGFPNFTRETIRKMLPGDPDGRTGRDSNFVSVYLEQLKRLSSGEVSVAGVVERPSPSFPGPVAIELLQTLHRADRIDANTARQFMEKMRSYRITDTVIFECVLDQGEYLEPLPIDKQGPGHKIPKDWLFEIQAYPRPLVSYVKSNSETMPVRVESFATGMISHESLMTLVVHTSRLLPRYAFPVGLDIVDKHAKVPEWMSRQMNVMLQAQLMRKAMESGNPQVIRLVRRILSANTRDWLFRPDFRKG